MSTPQQVINTGESPNDGTGEPLRDAFTAVNNNFANIWAAGPVNTNVVISNNVVSTNELNLDIEIAGNGIGNITLASTTLPKIAGVYDLGSSTLPFDEIHAQYFYGNGAFLTGISGGAGNGQAIVNGLSNVVIPAANSNITVGINGVSNVAVFSTTALTVKSNIIPSVNNNYNLGSATNRWQDLYLGGNTIYLGNAEISANSIAVTFGNISRVVASAYFFANGVPIGSGAQGISGSQGTSGAQGTSGSAVAQGATGSQGGVGPQGISGTAVAQGATGSQGVQGTDGAQGTEGPQGIIGAQGTIGIQGFTGIQGVQGTQGTDGAQGVQGTQGIVGIQGIEGAQGVQGVDGT
jgi:hypothetical protein